MYANDFEFDGRYLSDYGFVICDIGSDMDMNQVSAGGTVTIQTVRHGNGKRVFPVNATYESCIEADFTICKDPCVYDDTEISDDEMRDLMRWLNRRTYYKMRFLKEPENDDGGCFYNAAFNIDTSHHCDQRSNIIMSQTQHHLRRQAQTSPPLFYLDFFVLQGQLQHQPISFVDYDKSARQYL